MPIPADLFLSPDLSEADARAYLDSLGFRDAAAVDESLQAMAADPSLREAFGRIAGDLLPSLCESPDPDAAVDGLARYLKVRTGRVMFLEYLADDPRAMHALTTVLGSSPFLTEILIRDPEYFHWLVPQIERSAPDRQDLEEEVSTLLAHVHEPVEALETLKRWKRREILRIATRDLLRRDTVPSTTAQLSDLAAVIINRVLELVAPQVTESAGHDSLPGEFAVIAMGKLGGAELNYSSDVDLLYVYTADPEERARARGVFQQLARDLTVALTDHTPEGYFYRVDLRLRPAGPKAPIVASLEECAEHYQTRGETYERFAMVKARPIAGSPALGREFMACVQPFVYRRPEPAVRTQLPPRAAHLESAGREPVSNVKTGPGGIRELELFTQMFQLTNGAAQPSLQNSNTLAALEALAGAGLIAEPLRRELAHAYEFLRAVEHRLQLVHDAAVHTLPESLAELRFTARRLGLASAEELQKQLDAYRARIHEIYQGLYENR